MRSIALITVMLSACFPSKPGRDTGGLGEETGGEETGDVDHGEDSEEPDDDAPATLSGTVTVSLYETDVDGDVQEVSWTEATGDVWPFGALFIAAYVEDEETGEQTWLTSQTWTSPSTAGQDFELVIADVADIETPVFSGRPWTIGATASSARASRAPSRPA